MNFKEYQEKSRETALYPNRGDNLPYLVLGLVGEAGEVANKLKKLMRDHNFVSIKDLSETQRAELAAEMGDVLWYMAQMATELGTTLEEVAQMNRNKLASRKERGMLHGSGDER